MRTSLGSLIVANGPRQQLSVTGWEISVLAFKFFCKPKKVWKPIFKIYFQQNVRANNLRKHLQRRLQERNGKAFRLRKHRLWQERANLQRGRAGPPGAQDSGAGRRGGCVPAGPERPSPRSTRVPQAEMPPWGVSVRPESHVPTLGLLTSFRTSSRCGCSGRLCILPLILLRNSIPHYCALLGGDVGTS